MKLILDNNQLSETPEMFLREAGYMFLEDRKTGNESFVRPLNRGYYPRFHLYIDQSNGRVIFNLHLDQKQASYSGAHAHNGEYDGETVQEEINRIRALVPSARESSQPEAQNANSGTGQDILDKIRPKYFNAARKRVEKKSWWRKFFR